jgi:hypothetical protein
MQTLGCEGAPRALGLDQGRPCASAIRAWLEARGLRSKPRAFPALRRLTAGPALGAGVGREVVRHYPHTVERMSGIARAARVPLESLMEDVVASAYGGGHPLATPAVAVATGFGSADPDEAHIARGFAGGLPWLLRRSRPEVGFASVEVTLPWLAGAVAGVNEAGVAAAVATPLAAPRERGLTAAPAWLLVQECLQRFDGLDASLEWCLRRPSAGAFSLLLAGADGEVAAVDVTDEGTRLRQRGAQSAVAGGTPAVAASLRKRIAAGENSSADWAGHGDAAGSSQVRLQPTARGLEWRGPGSERLTVLAL